MVRVRDEDMEMARYLSDLSTENWVDWEAILSNPKYSDIWHYFSDIEFNNGLCWNRHTWQTLYDYQLHITAQMKVINPAWADKHDEAAEAGAWLALRRATHHVAYLLGCIDNWVREGRLAADVYQELDIPRIRR